MPSRSRSSAPVAVAAVPARATINDVARLAGVSKATVSRHLNARSDLLTPDISARVAAAIRSLDYRPSPAAQGLKRGRSRLVGLVVADVTNPYSVAVLHGAEAAFREAGYMVLLFNAGNDGEREREAMAALADYQVEGFIVHAPGGDGAALDAAVRRGRPVVLVDRRAGEAAPFDLVGLDNAGAVRVGVAHLLDAGYRELLFVGEPHSGLSSRQERVAAF
jgi:LacI family kdg operon repressor